MEDFLSFVNWYFIIVYANAVSAAWTGFTAIERRLSKCPVHETIIYAGLSLTCFVVSMVLCVVAKIV